ncbi:MAG: DinB family protein [Bacteroidetes bacterium]|nr:DinB family protein [Bacteroidota bacterium]
MKENKRIIQLYQSVYNGSPWIDVDIVSTLSTITAGNAAAKITDNWHSIWEIVNHLIAWRENVLQRMQGKIIKSPAHNYFLPVKNTSAVAWKKTLKKLEVTQQKWIELLQQFNEADFKKIYPGNQLSYYEHIHGIIHHDIYHLGQIVLLAKSFNKK